MGGASGKGPVSFLVRDPGQLRGPFPCVDTERGGPSPSHAVTLQKREGHLSVVLKLRVCGKGLSQEACFVLAQKIKGEASGPASFTG